MDELCTWFEVIRSLLPQTYQMRLIGDSDAIIIGSLYGEQLVVLTRTELAGQRPIDVMRALRQRLAASVRPRRPRRVA
jgi:hypothetical protein